MLEITPPSDNLHPVDPNVLGTPKTPPEGIIPASPNILGPDGPKQPTPEAKQPLTQPEQKETMGNTEWQRILDLGGRSFLDLTPEEIAELQSLMVKGKGLLGDGFNQELSRRNIEAKQRKKDKINSESNMIRKAFEYAIEALGKATKQKLEALDANTAEAEKMTRQTIVDIEEGKKNVAYEKGLEELKKDPQHLQAAADIEWLNLQTDKKVPDIEPALQQKIDNFRQGAIAMITTNPKGYERELQNLKAEFFKFRGIDLQNQSKTNTI